MSKAVIVSVARTPITRIRGALKDLHPSIYGGLVIKEVLQRAQVEGEEVDDVIFGNCNAGGGNIALVFTRRRAAHNGTGRYN